MLYRVQCLMKEPIFPTCTVDDGQRKYLIFSPSPIYQWMFPCKHLNINVNNYADLQMIMWSYGFNNSNSFICLFVLPIIFHHIFFNHLLYSKMWLKLGLGMTPKFHSTLRLQTFTPQLHSMTPLHSTQPFSTCLTTWDWYPLEIEIHLYSYVQSRLDYNLESPRLHSTF